MPYPAQGLYPSSLLFPLEVGVEFVNFTKDFKRFVDRYGRTLKNHRTNSSFHAIFSILKGTKCLGDGTTMGCGDAVAYVVPGLSYEIGDHISPVSGRGEWIIITERYASRIGDLRIFRALGLERYTPSTTLKGVYTIAEPATVAVDITGVYALTQEFVSLEMLSRYDVHEDTPGIVLAGKYDLTEKFVSLEMCGLYEIMSTDVGKEIVALYDITKTPAQIAGERAVATGDMIDTYWNPWNDEDLSYYKVHRSLNNGFVPSDANLVGVPSTDSFKHSNLAVPVQYYFKVCAVTKLGVSGAYSAQFTATTA